MRQKRLKSRHNETSGAWIVRVLKIKCPDCDAWATIKKTNRKHREIADIYCQCNDVECGHTFVMNLTFSHTISPSAKTGEYLKQKIISMTNPEELKQLALDLLKVSAG
ncbi:MULTISPECIES: ogr/Delta-like zinc finger family protein [Enterobacter cloacae complex]|uniref:ogr/Delta-like zinc finger family protein n=1 Tax=Enterobacter cloacae complex TaxID=354276 RepID=UPI001C7DB66E|nr:ogr/Delta-like zinc finger family protein [Enterobacter cancerogenus]